MATKTFDDDDILKRVDETFSTLDQQRTEGLETLKLLQSNRNFALEKEHDRLAQKYGENHPRVQAIATRLSYNEKLFPALDREIERSKIEVPETNANTWLVHGRVLDRENKGIEGLTVSLFDEKQQWVRLLGYACTNDLGYFAISYTVQLGEKPAFPDTKPLFLTVSTTKRQLLHRESVPVFVKLGLIDERIIFLGEEVSCGTPPDADQDNGDGDNGDGDNGDGDNGDRGEPNHPTQPVTVLSIDGPAQLTVNQEGTFTATVNADATPPVTYQWEFGDGAIASTLTATHAFKETGTFTVTFTARNPSNNSQSMTVRVTTGTVPPAITQITVNSKSPTIFSTLRFHAEVSGNSPFAYAWSFGDGGTSADESPTYVYTEAKLYTVTLVITDTTGTSGSRSAQLRIKELGNDK